MSQSSATQTAEGTIVGLDLAAVLVNDPERAIAFHRDVLGITPTAVQDRGAEFTLRDGTTFGVWPGDEKKLGAVGVRQRSGRAIETLAQNRTKSRSTACRVTIDSRHGGPRGS
jgi:catechol 2,3-dioxygenase-like lactoylglutathione lyase family enzyme